MKVPGWDCADGTPEEDHDWKFVSDWYGDDPGVINGTADCSFMRCEQCGKEREPTEAEIRDSYSDDFDD